MGQGDRSWKIQLLQVIGCRDPDQVRDGLQPLGLVEVLGGVNIANPESVIQAVVSP